jgi:SAM-dependent methyltransferase/uncharacterized protein YbaR (Trm112 family)
MRADFVSLLRCPARDCKGGDLKVNASRVVRIEYRVGAIDEVREGAIECPSCGRVYPIEEYVPSFDQLYPEGLKREGDYWGRWYGFMWERGFTGFFDLRNPVAPLIAEGIEVMNPATVAGIDFGGTHSIIADHPLLLDAELLLDIGSGTGWSSLYFARRGHRVVAFDPATGNMRLAKRYAISQGEYIEYMGAALGFLEFEAGVFDGAVALHSIHHVPNLVEEMAVVKGWLKDGAGIGVDEHVRDDEYLTGLMMAERRRLEEEVFPELRTLDPGVLEGIPRAEPSEMEGAGSEQVIESFVENFEVDSFESRYIAFDHFSWLYYLARGQDRAAYVHASMVVDQIYKFLIGAYPENAEHVTLIGHKSRGSEDRGSGELREQALAVSRGRPSAVQERLGRAQREIARLQEELGRKNAHVKGLEDWARGLERQVKAAQAAGVRERIRGMFGRR